MPQCKIRSFQARAGQVPQAWFHVDATDQVLGRLATRIARVLMGKHKPTYTSHVDTGDFVIVTNATKFRLSAENKKKEMIYPRYSYYPGGYKVVSYDRMVQDHPDQILRETVRRMLPKNALGRHMLSKLKIYVGESHPHAAQAPQPFGF